MQVYSLYSPCSLGDWLSRVLGQDVPPQMKPRFRNQGKVRQNQLEDEVDRVVIRDWSNLCQGVDEIALIQRVPECFEGALAATHGTRVWIIVSVTYNQEKISIQFSSETQTRLLQLTPNSCSLFSIQCDWIQNYIITPRLERWKAWFTQQKPTLQQVPTLLEQVNVERNVATLIFDYYDGKGRASDFWKNTYQWFTRRRWEDPCVVDDDDL
jgi:hypothetical protein